MKGLFAWLGFRQANITYVRARRVAGQTKWKYWQLWNLALEGIFSFTTLPLRIWTYLGLLVAISAFTYMAYIVVRTMIFGIDLPGYASMTAMILFFSGMNMIGLGMLGEYLGRVFVEVKQRPLYLVRELIGFDQAGPSHDARIGRAVAEGCAAAGQCLARCVSRLPSCGNLGLQWRNAWRAAGFSRRRLKQKIRLSLCPRLATA